MADTHPRIRLGAVQAAPVFLDRDASVAKACRLVREASEHGANLVAFPEGFIPAHPLWFHFHPATSLLSRSLDLELANNAVWVPGPEIDALADTAGEAGVDVVLGVCEKVSETPGTLYNTQVFVASDGSYLGKHRKLVPTVGERLIHAGGTGDTLRCFPTRFGAVSGLICGENWNPLAVFTLMAGQTRVHVMSWPAHFGPTMRAMPERVAIASRAVAHTANAFVVSSCGAIDPVAFDRMEVPAADRATLENGCGGSMVVTPECDVVAGPAGAAETIVYADVDLEACTRGKLHRDLLGHYNRPDIFELRINKRTPGLVVEDRDGWP